MIGMLNCFTTLLSIKTAQAPLSINAADLKFTAPSDNSRSTPTTRQLIGVAVEMRFEMINGSVSGRNKGVDPVLLLHDVDDDLVNVD